MKKIEAYKRMMQYILALVNFGVLLAIFMYYEVEYYSYYMTERVGYKGFMFVGALYFVFMYVFASLYGTVRIGYQKNVELVLSQIMATLMVDIITYFKEKFMYKLLKKEGMAKRGEFETVHGTIQTPVFMNLNL